MILIAENMGGSCRMSPVSFAAASRRFSSVRCLQGRSSEGSVSASKDGVDCPSHRVPVYTWQRV